MHRRYALVREALHNELDAAWQPGLPTAWCDMSEAEKHALTLDVLDILSAGEAGYSWPAINLLRDRIGGWRNLRSYLRSLLAQYRRDGTMVFREE